MPLDTVKNSSAPKFKERLGDDVEFAAPPDDGIGNIIRRLDAESSAKDLFLPQNQRSEADVYNAPLQAPDRFSMEPGNPKLSYENKIDPNFKNTNINIPRDPVLSDDEYAALVRLLSGTAKQL